MGLGQFSGSKGKYVYENDGGGTYILTIDTDLVTAGQGLTAFDPANPPAGAAPPPKRFKPRGVYWEGTAAGFEGKRKFLICGDVTATLYATTASSTLSVDGVAGRTTGRRGETLSF